MEINFIKFDKTHKEIWNQINNTPSGTFLTNLDWINFQDNFGLKGEKYLIQFEKNFYGIIYFQIIKRRFQKYLYSPYSPVIDFESIKRDLNMSENESLKAVISKLKDFTAGLIKDYKVNLFRMDPNWNRSKAKILRKSDFKKSMAPTQSMDSWIMDIAKPEKELLMNIKKDTRYYIRRAEKEGIEIIKASTEKDVDEFGGLMQETMERKGFVNYSTKYFVEQWKALNPKGLTEVFLAKHKDKVLAGALFNYHNKMQSYAHGASTSDKKLSKLGAPYLLQWKVMLAGKTKGIEKHNFWGVHPDPKEKNHAMSGLSMFKRKFPGELVKTVGGYDFAPNYFNGITHRILDWWVYKTDRYW